MATLEELFARRSSPQAIPSGIFSNDAARFGIIDPLTATMMGTTFSPTGVSTSRLVADPSQVATKSVIGSGGQTTTNTVGEALKKKLAEQGALTEFPSDDLRAILELEQQAFEQEFGPSAQSAEYFRTNRLRMRAPGDLTPAEQREQFIINQGQSQAGKDIISKFGVTKEGIARQGPILTETSETPGAGYGGSTTIQQSLEQLSQGPDGIQFVGTGPLAFRGEGGKSGPGGGNGMLGRNDATLHRIGGGILGAGLGLASGNPLLGAALAARGAYTGQAPTGVYFLSSSLLSPQFASGTGLGLKATRSIGSLSTLAPQ